MNKLDIEKMIEEYQDEFFFTGGITNEKIKQVEKDLDVQLPQSYKWFLEQYGYGGINGVFIEGVGLNNSMQVVKITKSLRGYGLPKNLIVIENLDEYVYCLDTDEIDINECPIVDWNQAFGKGNEQYINLYEYLYERFSDAIENL